MFGIGTGEFLALAVVALLVLGPEKLPKFAADAARVLRQLRRMADTAREDVRKEMGPEFADISLDDLNPRTFVRKHVLEPAAIDPDDLDLTGRRRSANGAGRSAGQAGSTARTTGAPGAAAPGDQGGSGTAEPAAAPPPFDPDTT